MIFPHSFFLTSFLPPTFSVHLPALSPSSFGCSRAAVGVCATLIEVWALDGREAGSMITHPIRLSPHLSSDGGIHICLQTGRVGNKTRGHSMDGPLAIIVLQRSQRNSWTQFIVIGYWYGNYCLEISNIISALSLSNPTHPIPVPVFNIWF